MMLTQFDTREGRDQMFTDDEKVNVITRTLVVKNKVYNLYGFVGPSYSVVTAKRKSMKSYSSSKTTYHECINELRELILKDL